LYFKDYLSSDLESFAVYKNDELVNDEEDDYTGEEIEMDRPKFSHVINNFNGPYQPNYGNQFIIDHLTLTVAQPPGVFKKLMIRHAKRYG